MATQTMKFTCHCVNVRNLFVLSLPEDFSAVLLSFDPKFSSTQCQN